MSLAANAPHAFALMHIDTNGVRAQRFARMEPAFKAAGKPSVAEFRVAVVL